MKIVFLLCLYNSKMKLVSGYGKICQLNMDYVNALVCVSVSLSLSVCKCVCIFVCVYLNVWLLRASLCVSQSVSVYRDVYRIFFWGRQLLNKKKYCRTYSCNGILLLLAKHFVIPIRAKN